MKEAQTFQVIFTPEPEGGFTVTAPAFHGCISYGATLEEARTMIKEAIELSLECMEKPKSSLDESEITLSRESFISLVTI